MSKFVFYLRTKEGHIERLGNMIAVGPKSLLYSGQAMKGPVWAWLP